MKMRATLGTVLLAALFFPAPTQAAAGGSYAKFRAWIVGCDNGRACRAYGFTAKEEDGADAGAFLRVDRGADPMAELEVSLSVAADEPAAGTKVELSADGVKLGQLVFGDTLKGDIDIPGDTIRDAEVKKAVLAAIRKAPKLTMTVTPPGAAKPGDDPVSISLDGAMAAFAFMDEEQKRGGTVTALARPGDRPAASIPTPPPLPHFAPLPHGNWPAAPDALPREVAQAWKKSECAAEHGASADDSEQHRLGRDTILVIMSCGAGAYNGSSTFFLYRKSSEPHVERLSFEDPTRSKEDIGAKTTTTLINSSFDDEKLDLAFFYKGRGIGDCGTAGTYRWDGHAFRPLILSMMPPCNGISSDGWITVWRTRGE
jgi:hypothetical protein